MSKSVQESWQDGATCDMGSGAVPRLRPPSDGHRGTVCEKFGLAPCHCMRAISQPIYDSRRRQTCSIFHKTYARQRVVGPCALICACGRPWHRRIQRVPVLLGAGKTTDKNSIRRGSESKRIIALSET